MINQFKSPRDKIIILINFVYILNSMINENSKNKPSGADEVFPIIVYVFGCVCFFCAFVAYDTDFPQNRLSREVMFV